MNPPTNARELLIAEALGDIVRLLDRIEAMTCTLETTRQELESVGADLTQRLDAIDGRVQAIAQRAAIGLVRTPGTARGPGASHCRRERVSRHRRRVATGTRRSTRSLAAPTLVTARRTASIRSTLGDLADARRHRDLFGARDLVRGSGMGAQVRARAPSPRNLRGGDTGSMVADVEGLKPHPRRTGMEKLSTDVDVSLGARCLPARYGGALFQASDLPPA